MDAEKLRAVLKDIWCAVRFGAMVAAILFVVFLVAGLLLNRFSFGAAILLVRGGLLVSGALALFVCAGLNLWSRGKDKITERLQWKRYFSVFGLFPVVLIVGIILLAVAIVVDYCLYL